MSKRDFCMQLAREDARRYQDSEPSLTKAVENDAELAELSKVLRAKAPKEITHLRTMDAWMRRASSVRMTQLSLAAQKYVLGASDTKNAPEESASSDVTYRASKRNRKNDDTESDILIEEKEASVKPLEMNSGESVVMDTAMTRGPVSVVSLNDDYAASRISSTSQCKQQAAASSVISAADSSQSFTSKRTTTHRTESIASQPNVPAPPRSVVPTPPELPVPLPPTDDQISRISIAQPANRSTVNTVVSLSSVSKQLLDTSEDEINAWYHRTISELEEKLKNGELRNEQFKRKRALLRAEYWTKLDKHRNNATPTVIG